MQKQHPLLDTIDTPEQLRQLNIKDLPQLCDEVRDFLINTIADTGGHFAAGLGAIEITVALHYVFDTPNDRLLWDVGHQTYPHKILTERKTKLHTIRKWHGLSPFPKRSESIYDHFGVGHSSTSISAATGMALAFERKKLLNKVVAIIGDGGMTAGMAYEAMNHLGATRSDVLIILNDNEMSISPNVGAMTNYLTRIISSKFYASVMESGKKLLKPIPPLREIAHQTKEHLKGMIVPGTIFEELGITYLGPVDGHNVKLLVETLRGLKKMKQPRMLHIVTRKGKGYQHAEKDPVRYHAVSNFNPSEGMPAKKKSISGVLSYSAIFGQWICNMAEKDERLMVITPAMREGSGLIEFEKRFPQRYFDVGIAEQHAVTLAAGLACEGLKPIVAIYSTFLQRAYDQLIHDVAIQNLPVVFAIDRAGLVGPDGQTHAGSFDLSYIRCIPNFLLMTPSNGLECQAMLNTAFTYDGPSAVRYPRDNTTLPSQDMGFETLPIGKSIERRYGKDIALLSFGMTQAESVAEELNATWVDMRFVKPLDTEMVATMARTHRLLVTIEDNAVLGGAGSAVNECLKSQGVQCLVLNLGIPDRFQDHGSRDELLSEIQLDAKGIVQQIRSYQH